MDGVFLASAYSWFGISSTLELIFALWLGRHWLNKKGRDIKEKVCVIFAERLGQCGYEGVCFPCFFHSWGTEFHNRDNRSYRRFLGWVAFYSLYVAMYLFSLFLEEAYLIWFSDWLSIFDYVSLLLFRDVVIILRGCLVSIYLSTWSVFYLPACLPPLMVNPRVSRPPLPFPSLPTISTYLILYPYPGT